MLPNDADTSNGTVHVSSILDVPASDEPISPLNQGIRGLFAPFGAWKSGSGSDMDLGL